MPAFSCGGLFFSVLVFSLVSDAFSVANGRQQANPSFMVNAYLRSLAGDKQSMAISSCKPGQVVWEPARPHLSHGVGQDVDDLLVGRGHHALPVDLDDAVAHADPATLGDAPPHQAADLLTGRRKGAGMGKRGVLK